MYPGRSAWTRGVLALGVGALFLLGWRIASYGDALSASPIDSDRNYFSVVVPSSGSGSRHDDSGKKEDQSRDGLGTVRQDRQAFKGDYSTAGEETRTASYVRWNVAADGEHGAGYLEDRSLPLSAETRSVVPAENAGKIGEINGEEGKAVDGEFVSYSLDSSVHSRDPKGKHDKDAGEMKSFVRGKEGDLEGEGSYWMRDVGGGEIVRHSRGRFSVGNVKRKGLVPSRNFHGEEEGDGGLISYSEESLLPLWNLEKIDGELSDFADQSFSSLDLDKDSRIEGENNGDRDSHLVNRLFASRSFERSIENESDQELVNSLIENTSPVSNHETSNAEDNSVSKNYLSNVKGNLGTGVDNRSTGILVKGSGNEDTGEAVYSATKTILQKKNDYLENKDERNPPRNSNRYNNTEGKNDYRFISNNKMKDSLPSFNIETNELEENAGEINSLKYNGYLERDYEFVSLKNADNQMISDDENHAVLNKKGTQSRGRQGEPRFSRNDHNDDVHDALNGSPVGERSDVEENLSREVNGRSMNEARKSLGQTYYTDTRNPSPPTLDVSKTKSNAETETPLKQRNISNDYLPPTKSNIDKQIHPTYNSPRGSPIVPRNGHRAPSTSENKNPAREHEESIFANVNADRNADVEFPGEIAGDFHNSARPSSSVTADREEGYKRGEESILGSVDSPAATRRPLTGMPEDRVIPFHRDHRLALPSAKAPGPFRSRKGRAGGEDRGRILERGTRETRSRDRSPGASDLSADFRGTGTARGVYVGAFDGYEITGRADRSAARAREVGSAFAPLRGNGELFDEEITRDRVVTDKRLAAAEEIKNGDTAGAFNLPVFSDDGNGGMEPGHGGLTESATGLRKFAGTVNSAGSKERQGEGDEITSAAGSIENKPSNIRRFGADSRLKETDSPDVSTQTEIFENGGILRDELLKDSRVDVVLGSRGELSTEANKSRESSKQSSVQNLKFLNAGSKGGRFISILRNDDVHREKQSIARRRRYTNYYSPQSVTPMAYVHIQPMYPVPAAPAPSRKCVQCMVVYKSCPSAPGPPSRNVLPTYKYQELASKWRGLKYGCRCNPIGSITSACDIVTGQCQCKSHVTGRQCDQCTGGFWGLATGLGCAPCECDPMGSHNSSCHDGTGQCYCKSGVGGTRCDTCLPGYYGFSSNGCQVCDACRRPGHVCDPDTGRCVCPTLTFGEHCDRCRPGSWDLAPGVGCRPCACTLGSMRPLCDLQGQCPCRIGYDGLRCERCAKGYYGYPRCRPCSCNLAGTLLCDGDVCDCNDDGQCPCKEHVVGKQCNQCEEGTFGLTVDNPKGCTECFCFGRTTSCQQAGLSWGQRRLTHARTLYINDTGNDIVVSKFRSQIFLSPVNGGLNVTNGFSIISDVEGDVTIPSNLYYNYPLYWKLPESFLGDKVVSYGGFLRFTTSTEGGIPLRSTSQYPIVQLQGNDRIILEYYLPQAAVNNHYEVRFHESLWQLQNRPDYKVTREVLMVALQNLQYILVKASDNAEFTRTTLLEASLDAAVLTPTHTPQIATGIEICQCPPEYNSTSCQDPSIGYYRWYKNTTVTSTIVIDLVGEAKRCQCNGRSNVCDIETGHCLDCRGNTAGPSCDICTDSFYGHPDFGCKPCPCPQVDKRFSNTCMVFAGTDPICVCKPGYTGRKCEWCSSGYYGFPQLPDGKCVPCNCNPAGSLSHECDAETGQCRCRAGSTGRDCSQCTAYRHVYINNVCTSCNDNCTGILLDTLTTLSQELAEGTAHIANGYIPPPWEDLSYIDANTTMFLEEIDLQNRLRERMKAVPWHDYRKLMNHVEKSLKTANEYAKRGDTLKSKSSDLKNNIFSAEIEMDNLRKYIEDTTSFLSQYSNDNKRVEIKKALKMGKMILNSLKMINLTTKTMEIENFLEEVAEYTDWLNSLYDATEPLAIAQDDAEEYSEKLKDMRNVIEDTMETLFTYDGLYNTVNQTLLEARNHCDEINILHSNINESATEGEKLTKETRGFIIDFQNNVQDLPELRNKLTYWFDKLSMKEELLYRLNYEYNDTYVIPAVAHVKNLSNYIDQYVSLFSETRNIAASPLKASQAYKNIADSIKTAKITASAAEDIVEDTYSKTFPDGPNSKSLLDSAKETSLASSRQMDSAKRHGILVEKADVAMERQKEAVNTLKNTLNNTGIRDNEVNVKLQNLQNDVRENVRSIFRENEEVSEKIEITRKLIEDYKEGISDRLKPKLYELKREGDAKVSLASEKLTEALSNIKKADSKLISLSNAAVKRKNAFDKWNDTLAKKLQNLKDKIAEARNTADGIRVSLKSAEGKECIRSYRPSTLQPASANTIVMTLALPKGKKEGSLFYLPSSINDDFLALEIVNRRVRFLWNVGGGTGIVTHPEVIESGDFQDDRFWYRIEAERVRHIGKLYVRKQASTAGRHSSVTNSTDSEYGRFDITTLDRVWIGGIPRSQRKRMELVAPNGLPGCVHQVILDGKPIGLWNFITTAPDMACRACVEGVENARDDTAYSFNGEGYAARNRVSSGPYNKYSFGVSISFRTYDENALLFLAINPENNQHIMIFLREGKVILHIGYGGNVSMEMSSKFKHNTGNWTKVDAFRHYQVRKNIEKCSLSVGGDADKRIGAPAPQPKKEDIPDLLQAKYYIGGVPPSFRAEKLMLPSQVSFLGCMSNIIVEEGYDPMAEQYYGVEPACSNKPLKVVGFYGDGYLQHSAYTLRKINSTVSFSFRTVQEEAVLLLSTFEGQEDRMPTIRHGNDETNRESYYSMSIINGHVQVRLNAGRGELVLQSNGTFNDGRYHSITLIKKRKDVELRIDDAYQSAGKLPTSAAIRAPEGSGGLYLGGLPVLINNTKMIATVTPLYGTIKDAIFNDEIIRFDDIVNFEHALIGRPGPSMGKDPPTYAPSASLSRGMSTQPEGCQKVPYYSLEAGALKFGDKPNSHTQLYLNFKKFWEKKYAIEFDFRTYYPNGLLFITPGLRPKHYLMVVMRDGQLLLLVKSKQKREILFKTPFNDGNWHHVVISHDERKLTLLVDTQTPRTAKVPRKIGLASMMYIGGLPDSGTPIPEQVVVKLETLKGCIRGLRINGNVYDMVGSTSRAYQVGQCFPNVESGAYFQDEAYAIYKRNFELGAVLELQLEFRTSELSGVLLSITAPGNSPSLSLELNNGKVIMSGDLGDNNPLYVEQRFTSPYTICDNRWHRIQAVYNDEELALKVDEMDQKYGLPANVNYHIMDSTASGPLYIGGLPASAPKGTLITRDNFNGCIRNVMIGGERRDWTDMDELHNIHLSSCPVQ